jgi:hypothetical protein
MGVSVADSPNQECIMTRSAIENTPLTDSFERELSIGKDGSQRRAAILPLLKDTFLAAVRGFNGFVDFITDVLISVEKGRAQHPTVSAHRPQ